VWLLSGAGLVSLLEFCNKRFETRQHSIQSSGEKDPVGNLVCGVMTTGAGPSKFAVVGF
jgi:hypothetical protein